MKVYKNTHTAEKAHLNIFTYIGGYVISNI